jgi:hypothetical protein
MQLRHDLLSYCISAHSLTLRYECSKFGAYMVLYDEFDGFTYLDAQHLYHVTARHSY